MILLSQHLPLDVMANFLDETVQVAVQYQIHVKLVKETVTLTANAPEILCVELTIVNLSSGIARQTLIAAKRVRHFTCGIVVHNFFQNMFKVMQLKEITVSLIAWLGLDLARLGLGFGQSHLIFIKKFRLDLTKGCQRTAQTASSS